MTLGCGHRYPETWQCSAPRLDHVHQPLPCVNGNPDRHHDFIADRDQLRRVYPDLLADISAMAPVLTRRERVELRKALLA